jgi:hypothetical protein
MKFKKATTGFKTFFAYTFVFFLLLGALILPQSVLALRQLEAVDKTPTTVTIRGTDFEPGGNYTVLLVDEQNIDLYNKRASSTVGSDRSFSVNFTDLTPGRTYKGILTVNSSIFVSFSAPTTTGAPGSGQTVGGGDQTVGGGGNQNQTVGGGDPTVGGPVSISVKLKNPIAANTLQDFIRDLVNVILTIAIPIVALAFIYSGFLFVKAQGDEEGLKKARRTFFATVIGAAILLGAWVLAQAIFGTIKQIQTGSGPTTTTTQTTGGFGGSGTGIIGGDGGASPGPTLTIPGWYYEYFDRYHGQFLRVSNLSNDTACFNHQRSVIETLAMESGISSGSFVTLEEFEAARQYFEIINPCARGNSDLITGGPIVNPL